MLVTGKASGCQKSTSTNSVWSTQTWKRGCWNEEDDNDDGDVDDDDNDDECIKLISSKSCYLILSTPRSAKRQK